MALRVLLADESSTIKRVFEISLKDLGLEIKTVQHGIDVIEVAESFQPDIIFADVLISKMNGYEVCAQIKQHHQLSVVPVVLMWSSFMEIDEDKYSSCRADGRLEKPFSNDQLRAKIQSLVPRSLDNPVSGHVQFSESQPIPTAAVRKRKDPTEELLFKEDLPLELPEEDDDDMSTASSEFLDPQALSSSLDDDTLDSSFVASSDEDLDPEVTDVDLELDLSDNDSDFEDDGSHDDLGLDGFQALDITGSYDSDLNNRWADGGGPSEFAMDDIHDDEVPLDFTPPPSALDDQPDPADDLPEVTAIPSLEEEAELLQMAQEDNAIRQFSDSDKVPTSNATSIKHRSIDELTDPDLIDELSADGGDLPPMPHRPVYNDPKAAAEILISKEELRALVHQEAKNMLQSVIWEVVPELAKQMIDKELKRLLAEEDPPQA